MAIRKSKPTSPGRRFATFQLREELTEARPHKPLSEGKPKSGGRNAKGRITSRHRGGGAKRRYRQIDFNRRKDGVTAKVATIEYDPNRTCYIALLHYADGEKRYILAPQGLRPGSRVESGERADIRPGNSLPLRSIPTGTIVHNVELVSGQGGRLGRAAGSAIQVARGRALERRAPERETGQGGPLPPQGQAPPDARRGDEPGRPSARRRRGAPHARRPSGHAVGQADPGLPDAQEGQGLRRRYRPRPTPW